MGMSTDAIAIFGWAYTGSDGDLEEKLEGIYKDYYGQPHNGIIVGKHCCDSEPYFFIAAEIATCFRGSTEPLQPLLSHDVQEMTERLRAFCVDNGVEFLQPEFLLLV
mgnify:FL=1